MVKYEQRARTNDPHRPSRFLLPKQTDKNKQIKTVFKW